jgi:hypothetical protein
MEERSVLRCCQVSRILCQVFQSSRGLKRTFPSVKVSYDYSCPQEVFLKVVLVGGSQS